MKVLLFTPSFRRPYMLRQCILNAKNQSYTDFIHSICILYNDPSEVENYDFLFDDIADERFRIRYDKNSSTHKNFIATMLNCPTPYDIYIKMDDDDIYKKDYVKTIVEYFKTHDCDILTSNLTHQLNNFYMTVGSFKNLGCDFPNHNYLMPNTYAFNHKAYQIISNIEDDNSFEDIQWRYAWTKNGLKDHNVDNTKNMVWHIHGKNISIGSWFRPE